MGEYPIKGRAVFLDRDGVLNRPVVRDGRPYPPNTVDEFELYEDAATSCVTLKDNDFVLVVVTNQPDVGRGTQSRAVVEAMHKKLRAEIPAIDHIEVCYHGGDQYGQPCDCRKPKTGMLLRAVETLGIDMRTSYLIGDRWRDVQCGLAAGCRTIFIDRGYRETLRDAPAITVKSFAEAAEAILCNAQIGLHSDPSAGRHVPS